MQFEVLEGSSSATFENCIFRSEKGEMVRIEKVKRTPDGRHWEAKFTLLEHCGDGRPAAAAPRGSSPWAGRLEVRTGDLLGAREDYLAHECSCVAKRATAGSLACQLFERYPEANVYLERQNGAANDVPGDVSVHGRVVNLYSHFAPGRALGGPDDDPDPEHEESFKELSPGRWDTAADRLAWFRQALEALPAKLPAEARDGGRVSLALQARTLGHGAAPWALYLRAISDFAKANPRVRVVIYHEEEGGPGRGSRERDGRRASGPSARAA